MKLDYEKEDEMIVIPQRLERQVKQEYALIGTKYVGHNSILITKIKQLESDLERETSSFENKLMLKNAELKQKDSEIDLIKRDSIIELLKRDSIIEKRDSTIALLKYENKELKTDMKMMVMEQQLLEQKRIIEKTNQPN